MKNYFLKIQYNGENYFGWNIQPQKDTIVSELTKALQTFYNGKIEFQGSGRTDRGVHAIEQTATIKLNLKITLKNFLNLMNKNLPYDIKIIKISYAKNDFHARYSAKNKTYKYVIKTKLEDYVWQYNQCWYITKKLNIAKMRKAAKLLCKEANFISFALVTKKDSKETNRKINSIVIKKEGINILFLINGNGFLKHMVRKIVATLVEIGLGNINETFIHEAFKLNKSSAVPYKAPAKGLYLKKVFY